jgi:hypothetical protein
MATVVNPCASLVVLDREFSDISRIVLHRKNLRGHCHPYVLGEEYLA